VSRLWTWWDDLFFRAGDRLVRLERRPKLYRSGWFLASWVSITLAAHYLGLFAGATHHFYSWVAAAAIGFLLTLLVFVIFLRQGPNR
jgi:hypothetical protein